MSDSVSSDYHQLFTRGTAREKYQLGNCNKFGPCRKWKTDKQVVLIRHIEEIAKEAVSESGSQFTYARDVLLPEVQCARHDVHCIYVYTNSPVYQFKTFGYIALP